MQLEIAETDYNFQRGQAKIPQKVELKDERKLRRVKSDHGLLPVQEKTLNLDALFAKKESTPRYQKLEETNYALQRVRVPQYLQQHDIEEEYSLDIVTDHKCARESVKSVMHRYEDESS